MKETTRITGVKRLNNSINGNPKYEIHTENGVVTTPTDSMIAYAWSFERLIGDTVTINFRVTKKGKAILEDIKEDILTEINK